MLANISHILYVPGPGAIKQLLSLKRFTNQTEMIRVGKVTSVYWVSCVAGTCHHAILNPHPEPPSVA